jgi:hypothetical protein
MLQSTAARGPWASSLSLSIFFLFQACGVPLHAALLFSVKPACHCDAGQQLPLSPSPRVPSSFLEQHRSDPKLRCTAPAIPSADKSFATRVIGSRQRACCMHGKFGVKLELKLASGQFDCRLRDRIGGTKCKAYSGVRRRGPSPKPSTSLHQLSAGRAPRPRRRHASSQARHFVSAAVEAPRHTVAGRLLPGIEGAEPHPRTTPPPCASEQRRRPLRAGLLR